MASGHESRPCLLEILRNGLLAARSLLMDDLPRSGLRGLRMRLTSVVTMLLLLQMRSGQLRLRVRGLNTGILSGVNLIRACGVQPAGSLARHLAIVDVLGLHLVGMHLLGLYLLGMYLLGLSLLGLNLLRINLLGTGLLRMDLVRLNLGYTMRLAVWSMARLVALRSHLLHLLAIGLRHLQVDNTMKFDRFQQG